MTGISISLFQSWIGGWCIYNIRSGGTVTFSIRRSGLAKHTHLVGDLREFGYEVGDAASVGYFMAQWTAFCNLVNQVKLSSVLPEHCVADACDEAAIYFSPTWIIC